MAGLAVAFAALVAAGGSGGAYYYFEVYKKKTATTDASGANTATITPATTTAAAATPAPPAVPVPAAPAAVTSPAPTAVTYYTFPGVDQNGGDIWSGAASGLDDCNSKCTANTGCVSTQFSNGSCWLKGTITPGAFRTFNGTLSFKNPPDVKGNVETNVDHWNADITGGYTAGDEAHCRQLGMLTPGAVASVYAPNEKFCWLKSGLTAAVSGNGDRNTFIYTK
ncbi:hypothetical protein ABBQ32_011346 [Trebouxia sp. C0010 RCD-2024]